MTPLDGAAVFVAGMAAGGINAVVGSGSLITFPVLIALGFPPVVANVSNNIGLVPGSAAGAYGYRRELSGRAAERTRLGTAAAIGALAGAILLLTLPGAFQFVVPVLIVLALVLVVGQPRINRWLAARGTQRHTHGGPILWSGVLGAAVYGGYFGAAQGVILLAMLAIFLEENLQRANGVKNLLTLIINGVAAIVFIIAAHPDWDAVGLIAAGSTLGGTAGSSVGRRLPPVALRVIIVVVGLIAILKLLLT